MATTPHSQRPVIGIPVAQSRNARGAKLYSVHQLYLHAIYQAGGIPCPLPLHLDDEIYEDIFQRLDGVLLTGGEDVHPQFYQEDANLDLIERSDAERDRVELLLARWAVAAQKPILGICRGHQLLNVALGGTLYQDIQTELGSDITHDMRGQGENFRQKRSHQVILQPDSKLAQTLGAVLWVNSLHHQAIATPGQGLRVVGVSPDGVIEATELEDHPFAITVQWHPEMLTDDAVMMRLFQRFVQAAARYHQARE